MSEYLDQTIKEAYILADKRILFLDYDGTIVPFSNNPAKAFPEKKTRNLIKDLAALKENHIVIISGRDCSFLETVFSGMNVTLVAEHGLFIRKPGFSWVATSMLHNEWKSSVREVLEKYRQQFSGSVIEEKKGSLAWHYRNCVIRPDVRQMRLMITDLDAAVNRYDLEILSGNCVMEVKEKGVNKGSAALSLLKEIPYGFILAAGDDVTDESLFKALPETAFSLKVGSGETVANYCCLSIRKITDLLRFLLI